MTAILAASMLALGVAVGAAIGPAPQTSLANPARLPALMATLAARAQAGSAAAVAATAPAASAAATPYVRHYFRKRFHRAAAAAAAETAAPAETTQQAATTPAKTEATQAAKLPPASKVWLIELSGSTFAEALAHASSAPYITTQAIPAGALLSGWTGIEGSTFATDAALIDGTSPQVLTTIVQPPCPEGTAGAACATGTPGALSSADEFLKATIPTITSLAAFRENGLIVVTFATVNSATATGLPAGTSSSTLTVAPPAGVLLVSPFASAGSRPPTTFTPASPAKSLERLLHR